MLEVIESLASGAIYNVEVRPALIHTFTLLESITLVEGGKRAYAVVVMKLLLEIIKGKSIVPIRIRSSIFFFRARLGTRCSGPQGRM